MKVLFDAFWWDDGPISNRMVQREIIRAWARLYPGDDLILALRRTAKATDLPQGAQVARTRLWPHGLANRIEIGRLQRRVRADVTITHNYTPLRGRAVVFVHDAMFVDHPEWFSLSERVYFSRMLPWARSAKAVATSTHTEAERIARLGRRIQAPLSIGLGVPPALTHAEPVRPTALPASMNAFALTVGRLNVRKNLEKVLAAAPHSANIDSTHPLVVVGDTAHSGVGVRPDPQVDRAVADGSIVFLGGVPDDQLAWLYSNATLAVNLSFDEGFGLPAIEAACFDTPLLASDIPVFRETVGDYAKFIAPDASARAVAEAIDHAWGATVDGAAVRDRYTWERSVTALRAAACS